jgi:pimeloyl-[acyl-carrier protein] methyl ester esterase
VKALPLILIAGWGHTSEAMLALKEALDGYPIKVTSTGELWQARSGGALPGLNGLSRYALGLYDLLSPFGGRVGVIGWSMGGIVALETARTYPDSLRRLVIVSGTARFSAGNDELPGVSASVLRAMVLGLRRMPDNVLAAYNAKVHAPQSGPGDTARAQAGALLDRGELIQGLEYLQRMDLRDGLNRLGLPTLVAHGREDRIVPWQAGEWLSRALAVSQWRCHEGLGHALPIRAPSLLAADVRAFLGDVA